MNLIFIVSIIMALVGVFYMYIGAKEKHKCILVAGLVWIIGAFLVYQFSNLWLLPVTFLVALFLNKNPKHD